jgi:DNA-binding transcriptional ArsR family regulator
MPDSEGHPSADEMELGTIFAALADSLRRRVVLALAQEPGERSCSSFDLPVTKATRTHHFRVLREAGLIRQRNCGNGRMNQLRRADLDKRFPGLIELVLADPK